MPKLLDAHTLKLARQMKARIEEIKDIFPDTKTASPDGLLCQGGTLDVEALLAAYSKGIFPWYEEGQPIMWWSPSPRCVLLPVRYHLPKKAAKTIAASNFRITFDQAFDKVLDGCADRPRTWLSAEMKTAYSHLHIAGLAHSVEAWLDGRLVGGLYGVSLGRAFFGESMFHTEPEASRACLKALIDLMKLRGMTLLDCQVKTDHIMQQGGILLPRKDFEKRLQEALKYNASSADALTMFCREDPETADALWPYLPWNDGYEHTENGWKAVPRTPFKLPGLDMPQASQDEKPLEEALSRLLAEVLPGTDLQVLIRRDKRRKSAVLRLPDSRHLEVHLPAFHVDEDWVCSFVRDNIPWIASTIEKRARKAGQQAQDASAQDAEKGRSRQPQVRLEQRLSQLLAEELPGTDLQIQIVRNKRRKQAELRLPDSRHLEVHLPVQADEAQVCSFVRESTTWIARTLEERALEAGQRAQDDSAQDAEKGQNRPPQTRIEQQLSQLLAERIPSAKAAVRVDLNRRRKKTEIFLISTALVELHAPQDTSESRLTEIVEQEIPWLAEQLAIHQEQERAYEQENAELGIQPGTSLEERLSLILAKKLPDAGLNIRVVCAKNVKAGLRLDDSGQLVLLIPSGMPEYQACSIMREHIQWIAKIQQIERQHEQQRGQQYGQQREPQGQNQTDSLEQQLSRLLAERIPSAKADVRIVFSSRTDNAAIRLISTALVELHAPQGASGQLLQNMLEQNVPWLAEQLAVHQEQERAYEQENAELGIQPGASLDEKLSRILAHELPDAGLSVRVVCSKNAKAGLRFDGSRQLVLRIPSSMPEYQACSLIKENIQWIADAQQRERQHEQQYRQQYGPQPVQGRTAPSDAAMLTGDQVEALADKTLSLINSYLADYALPFKVRFSGFAVRTMRTKWVDFSTAGEVPGGGVLVNSLFALAPEYVQRYLVCQALSLIKKMSTEAFQKKVRRLLPEAGKAEEWLKTEGRRCLARLP